VKFESSRSIWLRLEMILLHELAILIVLCEIFARYSECGRDCLARDQWVASIYTWWKMENRDGNLNSGWWASGEWLKTFIAKLAVTYGGKVIATKRIRYRKLQEFGWWTQYSQAMGMYEILRYSGRIITELNIATNLPVCTTDERTGKYRTPRDGLYSFE